MISIENAIPIPPRNYGVPLSFNPRLMKVFALVALTCIVFPLTPGVVYPNAVLDFLKAALATTQGRIVAAAGSLSSIAALIYTVVNRKACSEADLSTIVGNLRTHWKFRNSTQGRINEILKTLPGRRTELNNLLSTANKATGEMHANFTRRSQIKSDLNNPALDLLQADRDRLQAEYNKLEAAYPGLVTKSSQAHQAAAKYNKAHVKPLENELSSLNNKMPRTIEIIAHYEGLKKGKEAEIEALGGDLEALENERSELDAEYKRLKEEEYSLLNRIATEEAKSQSGSQQSGSQQ